jgi:hypothetical protein
MVIWMIRDFRAGKRYWHTAFSLSYLVVLYQMVFICITTAEIRHVFDRTTLSHLLRLNITLCCERRYAFEDTHSLKQIPTLIQKGGGSVAYAAALTILRLKIEGARQH